MVQIDGEYLKQLEATIISLGDGLRSILAVSSEEADLPHGDVVWAGRRLERIAVDARATLEVNEQPVD